ncbi:alpha/beta hydrolase [Actinomadura kijaniata]|uniref:alpha/beta hydrolase n=1 Tax=Actinomadura kijaniata TaxID=46161 RepID=UPI00082FEBD2|nr:alpha/beta fold hydrolase [Actinomadura kijaniata]
MGLLGWPLLVLLVALAVAAPAGCLLAWNRLPGPRAARAAARLGLIATCQVTALLLAGTLINRGLHLYASWDDLLGSGETAGGEIQAVGPQGGGTRRGLGPFRYDRRSRTYVARPVGAASGVRAEVRVWLPEEYSDPAHAGRRFPVIELFPGFPGSSWTWFGAMRGADRFAEALRRGQARPAILVAPTITVQPGRDTECSDIPGGPKVATWLTEDIHRIVTGHFRALPDASAWAAMGYSTGGFCAAKLAARHPDRYRAAVSLAGYFRPTSPDLRRSPALARANSPVELLASRPAVDLLLAGSREDPGTVTAIDALLPRVRPPTRAFTYIVPTGGHNVRVWRDMLPRAYAWLAQRLPGPS